MSAKNTSKVFGGTLLIAGTSIGAAMLAMPILTGLFGFFGTVVIMIACWAFMYWTATLILEASLEFKPGASFVTMAQATLGKFGALITWITFLLLFYSLVAAYLSGSGRILIDILEVFIGVELPPFFDILPLLVIFAPFIYFGLDIVDKLNRLLVIGMLITYIIITVYLLPSIEINNLLVNNFSFSLLSFSIVVTSFGYHVIIPTLVTYLDRDIKSVKKCLFYGSFVPLVIYFIWELVILGSLKISGDFGLAQAFALDIPLVKLLRVQLNNNFISYLAQGFSIFAIVTSFLGVAQGLFDFLKDGINSGSSHKRRLGAFLLTFIPPIFLILFFERGFISMLEYAGALVAIILGIIPILICWQLRTLGKKQEYRAIGGFWALGLGVGFFVFVVLLVVFKNTGIINFSVQNLI